MHTLKQHYVEIDILCDFQSCNFKVNKLSASTMLNTINYLDAVCIIEYACSVLSLDHAVNKVLLL